MSSSRPKPHATPPAAEGPGLTGSSLQQECLAGLKLTQKKIPPKFLYDEKGSALFEQITQLPEYYITRLDEHLLCRYATEIAACTGSGVDLIEFGSGSSRKVGHLLQAIRPSRYTPMDIAREQLAASSERLQQAYPWLQIQPVFVDYTREFSLPAARENPRRLGFFPGSSIGNFEPVEAVQFLQSVARLLGDDGLFLLGFDLKKDPAVLHAAYNDQAGVTDAFNLNLLQRLNRDLDADFDTANFRHYAFYNPAAGRIEMHLLSMIEQRVNIAGEQIVFTHGESIHTENSYKYTSVEFTSLATLSGFDSVACWTDAQSFFEVRLLKVKS